LVLFTTSEATRHNNTMSGRKMTPRGQMSRGTNSGPAIMLMPPHIRATFMPAPPLKPLPIPKYKRKNAWTGMSQCMNLFEKDPPPPRKENPTPKMLKLQKQEQKKQEHQEKLLPLLETYRKEQRKSKGEFNGMNCYNSLFIGRLAYEVTERKLLREMESFGAIKDIKIVKDRDGKSKGFAFVEYDHEEDMKRAYRAADGMRIEGREIVADVERGHTVPTWLPRRLGGGLGGTRYEKEYGCMSAQGFFSSVAEFVILIIYLFHLI
jgi:U1 small nuclear ribonucleoprotein 70kDa